MFHTFPSGVVLFVTDVTSSILLTFLGKLIHHYILLLVRTLAYSKKEIKIAFIGLYLA